MHGRFVSGVAQRENHSMAIEPLKYTTPNIKVARRQSSVDPSIGN
jgi:hypothetical protein